MNCIMVGNIKKLMGGGKSPLLIGFIISNLNTAVRKAVA